MEQTEVTVTRAFTVQQRNNLLVGNPLAAELPASSDELQAWVEVAAYSSRSTRSHWEPVSTILNADRSNQRYELRWCEIEKEYTKYPLDWDNFVREQTTIQGIPSIEALEGELAKYLDDFSALQVSWKTETPGSKGPLLWTSVVGCSRKDTRRLHLQQTVFQPLRDHGQSVGVRLGFAGQERRHLARDLISRLR